MIKIFKGKDLGVIEQEVNDFMFKECKDLPVRTNVLGDTFVCTVFWNQFMKK